MGGRKQGREEQNQGKIASMMSNIKIATWNLCLGLASKKELVKKYVSDYKLDVWCLQETELDINLNADLLSFPGYAIEVEKNDNNEE